MFTKEEIMEMLHQIGDVAQVAGTHMYNLALKQVYVDVAAWLTLLVIILFLRALSEHLFNKSKAANDLPDYNVLIRGSIGVGIIAIVFSLVFIVIGIPTIIQAIINPEYAALLKLTALLDLQ